MGAILSDDRKIVVQAAPPKRVKPGLSCDPLISLPVFTCPDRGRRPVPLQGGLKDNPVPIACWECGKALVGRRIRFCSNDCAKTFPVNLLYGPAKAFAFAADGLLGPVGGHAPGD